MPITVNDFAKTYPGQRSASLRRQRDIVTLPRHYAVTRRLKMMLVVIGYNLPQKSLDYRAIKSSRLSRLPPLIIKSSAINVTGGDVKTTVDSHGRGDAACAT